MSRDLSKSFNKWDQDLKSLIELLGEVLDDLKIKDGFSVTSLFKESHKPSKILINAPNIQAISICFHLLNMVEENIANQTRRSQAIHKSNLWLETFSNLKADWGDIGKRFNELTISPVFTAHPTEAKRHTVLEHYRSLYLELLKLENLIYSDPERETIKNSIKSILEILLRTGDLYIERPKVEDELKGIVYYLTNPIPSSIEQLYHRYRTAWAETYPELDENGLMPPLPPISFGTWVGGDRDGHPFVTSEVTKTTLRTLRAAAINLISQKILVLIKFMSLNDRLQAMPEKFTTRLNELLKEAQDFEHKIRNPSEPWRQYLDILKAKVTSTRREFSYNNKTDLINDLEIFRQSLVEIGAKRLATLKVEPLMAIVNTFGFHLATLDIRQNSSYHDLAIDQLLSASGVDFISFSSAPKEKRARILEFELSNPRPFASRDQSVGTQGDETRNTLRVLKNHLEEFGRDGLGSLIVSMTRDETDLLSVYLLCKEVGLLQKNNESYVCPLPVVPLFETIEDLKASKRVMDIFLKHPISVASKLHTKPTQEVMIGYSDSSKDGGVLASAWNLYCTQEDLIEECKDSDVPFLFFHGRGGTVSRGAGPTERFLSALPEGALNQGLKMTEQGETISQKYANSLTASYSIESLFRSTVQNIIRHRQKSDDHRSIREILNTLSEISKNKYQELLSLEGFITYFRNATPIDVIEKSKFGSRPPKRGQANTLDDLRAIPWVFAWNQSRFFLSGWYGVGSALDQVKKTNSNAYQVLIDAIKNFAPAEYIFTNIESSIYSANLELMKEYSDLVKDKDVKENFEDKITKEFILTKNTLGDLFPANFSTRRPRLAKTLELREFPLKTLHLAQIEKLNLWREEQKEETLTELFLITNAIAGGLRTTG